MARLSAELLGRAFKADIRPHAYKLVFLKLVDAAQDDGTKIFPSIKTIAKAAGVSERHTKRILQGFVGIGLLRIVSEGGKGRGDTREYVLDLGILDRLATRARVTFRNGKGSTSEKGDTAAPSEKRVTSETLKGDSGVTQPLSRPLKDSRERARASETPAPQAEARPKVEFLPPDDLAKVDAALAAIVGVWPPGAVGNVAKARGILADFSAGDRDAAVDAAPRFLRSLKDEKRRYTPAIETFLSNRDFDRFPPPAKADAPQSVELKPYVRPLWALLWRAFDKVTSGKAAPATFAFALDRVGKGLVTVAPAIPPEAECAALVPVKIDSAEHAAWKAYAERHGFALPRPDEVPVIFVPQPLPPDVKLKWRGYRLAVPRRIPIRSPEWWWRLMQPGAPIADALNLARRHHGAEIVEFGPLPTSAEVGAMVEIRTLSDQWEAWSTWFAAKGGSIDIWVDPSIYAPSVYPPAIMSAKPEEHAA